MIARPTTERLILECCRHLIDDVAPHVADEAASEQLVMLETILRNAAVRAAHEIAWMTDEIESVAVLCADAPSVLAPDDARAIQDVAPRLEPASQHLSDVVESYAAASTALAIVLSADVDRAGVAEIRARAQEIIDVRLEREAIVMGMFEPTGRD